MIQAALTGDVATTRQLAMLLHPVVEAGFAEPNPAVFKAALHVLGRIPWRHLRAPMAEATPAATRWLLDAIRAATA